MEKKLVAVADDHAVGLLSASTDIDVATLGACFELQPFGNLVMHGMPQRRNYSVSMQLLHGKHRIVWSK